MVPLSVSLPANAEASGIRPDTLQRDGPEQGICHRMRLFLPAITPVSRSTPGRVDKTGTMLSDRRYKFGESTHGDAHAKRPGVGSEGIGESSIDVEAKRVECVR